MQPEQKTADHKDAQQQIRSLILDGGYAPGDRLPAERELISSLGISRSHLRKGLDALEREGTIWRHVGKGTFVSGPDEKQSFPGLEKLSQEITPVQMMRARIALEPAIAKEAAANASADAMRKLYEARDNTHSATNWDAYEQADDALHRAIAEASGNVLLVSLYDQLNQVQRAVTWGKVVRKNDRPPRDHTSFAEHDLILNAIETRNPTAANDSMRAHLNSVSARLFGDV